MAIEIVAGAVYCIQAYKEPQDAKQMVVDLTEGDTTPGNLIQLYEFLNNGNQRWRFEVQNPPGPWVDRYMISLARDPSKVIEWIDEGPTANKTIIADRKFDFNETQKFFVRFLHSSGLFVLTPHSITESGLSYVGTAQNGSPVVNQPSTLLSKSMPPNDTPHRMLWSLNRLDV